eukprot:TRINITY_DN10205_c0_g2_i1.p1 TRINITY_DN10205_c0_g2~~TRINITY_DN10205_c0_g2_i1.p1  ORF type:complete len:448 (+),score=33.65 TRINITY_DN10205_c0_g2_i1:113-1456(+)
MNATPNLHDGTQATLTALQLLQEQGFQAAAGSFKTALALNESHYGCGHPKTIASAVDFSQALHYEGRFESAAEFLEAELERAQQQLGGSHGNLVPLLRELSQTYEAMQCLERAIVYSDQHVRILQQQPSTAESGVAVVRVMRRLGHLCSSAGNDMRALGHYSAAAKMAQDALGPKHKETIICYYGLSCACEAMGDILQSQAVLKKALALIQRSGVDHDYKSRILAKLGARRNRSQRASPSRSQRRSRRNQPPLPPGWSVHMHTDGRLFFANHITHETTWSDPRSKLKLELPSGWEQARDSDGLPYYIDHNTKTTQRDPPPGTRPAPRSVSSTRRDALPPEPVSLTRQSSQSSLISMDSVTSLVSTVSSLTRSLSMASINSFNSAKAMLTASPQQHEDVLPTTAAEGLTTHTAKQRPPLRRQSVVRAVFGSGASPETPGPLSRSEQDV